MDTWRRWSTSALLNNAAVTTTIRLRVDDVSAMSRLPQHLQLRGRKGRGVELDNDDTLQCHWHVHCTEGGTTVVIRGALKTQVWKS